MTTCTLPVALAALVCAAQTTELNLDQQLIVGCYKLRVDDVVACLRKGANINATFGDGVDGVDDLRDRWIGTRAPIGAGSWTPLIALANAPEYPDPSAELGEIWKDRARARALRKQIPREQIEKRRRDTMLILLILLSHNCSLNDDDGFGATALYCAANKEKVQMVRVLLQNGANPNTKTRVYIDGPPPRPRCTSPVPRGKSCNSSSTTGPTRRPRTIRAGRRPTG